MQVSRRVLLGVGVVAAAGAGVGAWRLLAQSDRPEPAPAQAPAAAAPPTAPSAATEAPPQAGGPRFTERAVGRADAPVTVIEFYSLTCSHCASFVRDTLPRVKADLIETGKLRLVYWDFPLDQVALTAAMVARSLPPERYEAFCGAL